MESLKKNLEIAVPLAMIAIIAAVAYYLKMMYLNG